MTTESRIIETAEFNPKIKSYLFIYISFIITATVIGIPLLIIWFFGLGKYTCKLYYSSLKCSLTTRHLMFKKGAFFKVEKTIPLENIQDLTFIDNPVLKYFNLRILKVETAGHSNPHGSDMKLIGIMNSSDFKEKVLSQRELLNNHSNSSDNQQVETNNNEVIELLKDIKVLLKDIKNK